MTPRVFYRGFELKPDTKLLLEFDDEYAGRGRIFYALTAQQFEFYQDPDRSEDFDIDETMGFCIDGNEHTYPNSIREIAPGEDDPISIEGLPKLRWKDLEEDLTVVIVLRSNAHEPLTFIEKILDEDDLEEVEEEQIYPFSITINKGSAKIYLKESV